MDEPLELGIDASALLTAKYGPARYVRAFLMDLIKHPQLAVTLIADEAQCDVLQKRFVNISVNVAEPKEIRRQALDVCWFPWGTMNFATDAAHVLTLHDAGAFSKPLTDALPDLMSNLQQRRNLEKAVRRADHVFTLSEWSKRKISESIDINLDAISAVPPLPDSSWAPGQQELKYAELGDMPYILSLGGWKSHHDMEFLLHAFSRVFHKSEVQLVVAGPLDPNAAAELAQLPYHLHLPNALDDGELRGLYRNATAVVHVAPKSHWSQITAEALCCGAAVIAADGGSVPEIIGDAGLAISLDEHRTWLDALDAVVNDEDWNTELRKSAVATWGKSSRRTSIETVAAIFEQLR